MEYAFRVVHFESGTYGWATRATNTILGPDMWQVWTDNAAALRGRHARVDVLYRGLGDNVQPGTDDWRTLWNRLHRTLMYEVERHPAIRYYLDQGHPYLYIDHLFYWKW